MEYNWLILFGAALIPLVTGFVWYHPKVFGNTWMRAAGLTDEQLKGSNMAVIFGLTYLLGLFLALSMTSIVIHQAHVMSTLLNEPGFGDPESEIGKFLKDFMDKYGRNFRTFGHGAFHGALAGFLFALPVLGINALFERKGRNYIAIHAGYWIVTLALIGGVVCAYL